MDEVDVLDLDAVRKHICTQAAAENICITLHAQQEIVEEEVTLDEVLEAIATGQILENAGTYRNLGSPMMGIKYWSSDLNDPFDIWYQKEP